MHGHFPGKLISQLAKIIVCQRKIFSTILFTQQLLDHESYYLNITDANLTNKPKWQLEYTVKVRHMEAVTKLSQIGIKSSDQKICIIIAIKIVHPGTDF